MDEQSVNGVFNLGLNFSQLVIILIIAIIGIVTIRFSFKFDINKHREAKQKSYRQKLMNACTHVKLVKNDGGDVGMQSCYVSPPGTLQWQCQRCGHITHNIGNEFETRTQHYIDHIDDYKKDTKKFQRLLKKAGMI